MFGKIHQAPGAGDGSGGSMAVAIDGHPADDGEPSANARQSIRILGSGYNRFTEVLFRRANSNGAPGTIRVQADAVSADGTIIEVVVPDQAVTGQVRVAGAPGDGIWLQITPTLRPALPADPTIGVNFDVPLANWNYDLFGSGLVEGDTRITFGGVLMDDNSVSTLLDVMDLSATGFSRSNGRLRIRVPDQALAGPVRVETDGGWFEVATIPIQAQDSVGLESIDATAAEGTPWDAGLPSANTGQAIVLRGFGFATTSHILFTAVAEDGTRGQVVVQPTSVASGGTEMTVPVPALAVTGPVTVAGSASTIELQIVPTLNGISAASLPPIAGQAIRLSGTGIPEAGAAPGQQVTYTFGGDAVTDTGGGSGPDVFSALDDAVEVALTVPAGATGSTVAVTTAGGTATLDLGAFTLSGITAVAAGGTPAVGTIPSANTAQTITLHGAGFGASTRVRFAAFDSDDPADGLTEREVVPASVAADGSSLEVVVPGDAVTGVVRLSGQPAGLILQIVPTVDGLDIISGGTYGSYSDGSTLRLTGSGLVEGDLRLLLGTGPSAVEVADAWNVAGPNPFGVGYLTFNDGADVPLPWAGGLPPIRTPAGPITVATLGGQATVFPIAFTGIAPGTVAGQGTPTDPGLPSANVRQTITVLGAGFDAQTEVIFPTRDYGSSADVRTNLIVTPSQVAPDGTSLEVVVPDAAMTGDLRIVGAWAPGAGDGSAFFLQVVPTIVQVVTPTSFATGQTVTIQGSGFIENDVTIGLGNTFLLDTGPEHGPDVRDVTISFAGKDRTANDGIVFSIPPGATDGPWLARTAGGTARFGVIEDLGTVVYDTRGGRTVAPGEQELFKAAAAVEGWLDWAVHYSSGSADLQVLNEDGTPATIVDLIDTGTDVLLRVAAEKGQIFFLQTNGVGTPADYGLEAINHDRFDDPVGPENGDFAGHYGSDPDGRNETADAATDFTPAVYVVEELDLPWSDVDWHTWVAQATGLLDVSTLFTPANGELAFRVYADADDNGVLDPAEAAAPVATSALAADGAHASAIPVDGGQRIWVEVFGVDGDSDGATDHNVYTLTFSNVDLIDAGLLVYFSKQLKQNRFVTVHAVWVSGAVMVCLSPVGWEGDRGQSGQRGGPLWLGRVGQGRFGFGVGRWC